MLAPINMRSNYPVLAAQEHDLKAYLDRFCLDFNSWFNLNPISGMPEEKEVAAKWISKNGTQISPNRIAIATGGHHACLIVLLAAKLQGKVMVVDEISYPNFIAIAQLLNIRLLACKGDKDGMLPNELLALAKEQQVAGVYLMPTLHNPTGAIMPLERRLELVAIAKSYDLVLIDDDAYGFLADESIPNFAQLYPENGWYVYSLSKPLGPDIKVAYLAFPEKYSAAVHMAIQLSVNNPSTFFTAMVTGLIKNGQLEKIINAKKNEGRAKQAEVRLILKDYAIQAHVNSWHIWLKLPEPLSAAKVSTHLLLKGVDVFPGALFAAPGIEIGEYIRIALGGERDFEKSLKATHIIQQALEELSANT